MNQQADLPLPANFDSLDECLKANLIQYLGQLDPIEKKAYKIAKDHLGTSFHIVRSVGYNDWILAQQSSS